ncbi:MAG: rod shape-determining protein MreC [Verrucomicrobiota bacterium]
MARTSIIIAAVIIILLAVIGTILPSKAKESISTTSHTATSPIWSGFGWVNERIDIFTRSLKTLDDLQQEVTSLRALNAQLQTENASLRGFEDENNRLREMLNFKTSSNYKLLACRVIEREPSNWWNTVIINKGWQHDNNLASDQPVVSPRGIVGKTGTVGPWTTKVMLLVDENCKISGVTETSQARGIIIGSTSFNGGKPSCRITFVSREAEFTEGERVFTTGLGGTFPPNLIIGLVSEAPQLTQDKNFGLFREGTLQPSVDLDNLEELFVILGID